MPNAKITNDANRNKTIAKSARVSRKRKPVAIATAGERAETTVLVPSSVILADDCEIVASQVRAIIRSFHSSVASPLASIGLQLELLRLDGKTNPEASAELNRITRGLDEIIAVVRGANRDLRKLEQQILSHNS